MKSKKIIASLALTSMLFSTVASFAEDRDIWSVSPEQVFATKREYAQDVETRKIIAQDELNYYFEAHGHLFTMQTANEAFAKNPEGFLADLKVENAVKPINLDLHVVEVKAINSTEAQLVFNKEVKEARQANFKAMDKDGGVVVITDAKVDAKDKTKVVLAFAEKFKDKMEYTVESEGVLDSDGKAMAKDSDKFTYEAAEVKTVEFTSTMLGVGKDLIDYVKVTDALGRDVTKEVTVEFESSDHTVVNPVSKKTVAPGNAELIAKVKVGADWVKSAKTVVKVSNAVATTFAGYYLYNGAAEPNTAAFESLPAEKKVDYIHIGDTAKLGVYFKDQFGGSLPIIGVADLDVDAQTPNIAVIDKTTLVVTGVNEGDAYFKVKNKVAKTENLIKVTVKGVSKPTVMELKEKKVDMSPNASVNTKTLDIVYKNQFGDEITPVASGLTAASSDNAVVTVVAAGTSEAVTLTAHKKGMATITLTYREGTVTLKETVEVAVEEPGDMAGYKAIAKTTKLDAKLGATNPPNETTVRVYEVDEKGRPISEVALNGTTKKLVAVNAEGKDDESIVKIAGANLDEVQAVAEGTGYVKVVLDTITLDEKLTFEVVNTGQTPTKVGLRSSDLVIGDGVTYPIPAASIVDKVEGMLEFKDQKNRPMTVDPADITVEYSISKHNEAIVFNPAAPLDQNSAIDALVGMKSSKADIVVKKVTVVTPNGPKELTPENELRIRLTVNDFVAPVVGAVTENGVYNADQTPSTTSADADTAKAKAYKNDVEIPGWTWSNSINGDANQVSRCRVELPDKSGNVAVVNFIIDKEKPKVTVRANKAVAKIGDQVVFTATFTEPVKAGVVPQIELKDGQVHAPEDMTRVNDAVWKYEHTMIGGNGDVKAEITVATDVAGNALEGDFSLGNEKETGLVADNTAPTATLGAGGGAGDENEAGKLILKFTEELYIGGVAVQDGADLKDQFTANGVTVQSAVYDKAAKTVLLVITEADADTDTITHRNTFTDVAGNLYGAEVYTYATGTSKWS